MPTPMSPDISEVAKSDDNFFAYYTSVETYIKAIADLESYVAAEGPFDAILAFSAGASLAATYLAHVTKQKSDVERSNSVFKCAIFFSTVFGVFSADMSPGEEARQLTPDVDGELIRIPTAHIWGSRDSICKAQAVIDLCPSNSRQIHTHQGGHEIPGVRSPETVKACVHVIRRVITMATQDVNGYDK